MYYFTLNTDVRGSVTSIVRPDGSLASGYVYDEFGNQIKTGELDFLNEATYTGAIYDSETELMYMNARYLTLLLVDSFHKTLIKDLCLHHKPNIFILIPLITRLTLLTRLGICKGQLDLGYLHLL